MIVLDASALLDALLGTDRSDQVLDAIGEPNAVLCAPDHMMVETARVLRRYALSGVLTYDAAGERLRDALDLDIATFPSTDLITRAWEFRSRFSLDDALYVALAESLPGTLVTTDQKLAKQAASQIEVLPEARADSRRPGLRSFRGSRDLPLGFA